MTLNQITLFFANFGYQKDKESKPASLKRYTVVVTTGARWFGPLFGQFVADCFVPIGKPEGPGEEDSSDTYQFEYPNFNDTVAFVDALQQMKSRSRQGIRKEF